MKTLPLKIGFRYSYARQGSRFIGLNSILAVVGITIGIAALIVVMSVMNGVSNDVREKLLAMTAQVSIRPAYGKTIEPSFKPDEFIKADKRIIAAAPYVQGQGLIGNGDIFQGVLLHGIYPEEEIKISTAFARVDEVVRNELKHKSWNIVMGEGLINQLGVKVGDKITIVVPKVSASPAGLMPRMKRFTLIGSFSSGHYQYDHQLVMINAEDAKTLLQLDEGVGGYQIKIHNSLEAPQIRNDLQKKLPLSVYASDWSLDQAVYFNAVQMEKNAMFIILSLIVMVAAFGLLSSMYMVVSEKRRDIAILRTLGMTRGEIARIFLSQGMIFGILGTILGVSLGIIIALNVPYLMDLLEKMTGYHIPPQLYFISQLSAEIDPKVVFGISFITLAMTLIFSLIPAFIAAKVEPARALSIE